MVLACPIVGRLPGLLVWK